MKLRYAIAEIEEGLKPQFSRGFVWVLYAVFEEINNRPNLTNAEITLELGKALETINKRNNE